MKDKSKIQCKEEVKKTYFIYCPYCNEEIKGNAPRQVEWNLKIHIESKHSGEKK